MLEGMTKRNPGRVARELRGLSEAERRALAPELLRHARSLAGTGGESVVHVALVGTATLREIRRLGSWSASTIDVEHGLAVLLDRRPDWLQEYAEWRLTGDGLDSPWPLVRGLVRAGAIERPGPTYLSAMIRASRPDYPGADAAAELVAADPALLEREVWDLLTSDTGEESLRAADTAHDWAPGAGWSEVIRARLPRDRVLDAVLDGLANDMAAYRAAWHTKLWKDLAPTPAELAARADRLRVLLGAAAEPIVAFAVEQLTRAKVPVPADDLAPALAASSKKTVRAALKLLGDEPEATTIALGHPDPAVQGAVLDRLERTVLDDGARGALLRHLDLLAATQRPRAEALLGLSAEPEVPGASGSDVTSIPAAIREALNFGGPLPPAPVPGEPVLGEPLAPIASLEELAASLGERHEYGAPFPEQERQLDAILRHCGTREPFAGPLAQYVEPLREHAAQHGLLWPMGVAASWLTGVRPTLSGTPSTWSRRLAALGVRAASGEPGPLLALPTHAGGWIDPRVLVQRLLETPQVDEVELAQALLRVAPDGRGAALVAAADVPGRAGEALRCALGGDSITGDDEAAVAARAAAGLTPIAVDVEHRSGEALRAVDALRVVLREHHRDHARRPLVDPLGGLNPRSSHYANPFVFPARRDLVAAVAISRIGWHLDTDSGVITGTGQLFPLLLREREPIAPLTLRLLVLGLGSSFSGEHLLAVDVLIAAIDDGRVDALPPDDIGLIKPNRLAARLTAIAEAGPLQRAVVRELLDASIHLVPARSGPLLVLFDELCAQTRTGPRRSRRHLGTSKHKAAKALLKRQGDPPAEEAELALAARVRRARRWMDA